MKQEIIGYLESIKEDLFEISSYLYNNPEESFKEYTSCEYLCNFYERFGFKVKKNIIGMPTSFSAEIGSGHPKVCFICEYDAVKDLGHITGHNLLSAISTGAALGLSKVISKLGGSIIVLGCPGEFLGGSKVTMAKQGIFEDIDVVLVVHPDIITAESGTSMALIPLKINYKSDYGLSYRRKGNYSALDACMLTFNSLNILSKGFGPACSIDGVIVQGGKDPHLLPNEAESKFYIRATKMNYAEAVEYKIRSLSKCLGEIMNIDSQCSIYEIPYDELITNSTLSRLFSHNLKEAGIIDIEGPKDTYSGLSLGTVSHSVPCIHPYISIVQDNSIKYSSKEFAQATISDFAKNIALKASHALAFTAIDIIQKETLLQESRKELTNSLENQKD
ncbi:amidohydrolase [Clostridium pascui]|uniref:M20 family peptidase n=1 Tax=Clostridium pascui TaxID=46609 RepID=UPI001959D86C|nr:M20 family peptidase [Clostridium pascui]MBM7870661.1 amidohydrolase [Clostridium pascui]